MARADISSVAFNSDTTLLAVSSTNGTTHIFDIVQEQEKHKYVSFSFPTYIVANRNLLLEC